KISGEKDKKVQTRTDGDPTDNLPIKVTVEAGGLNVFVPETSTSTKE
ncbi:TPA: diacylglycerol kinase family lipid kinase, partial [Enterococcus faecalis]|nr:diacylglycerol kinase family lipid kinase [Enterococcus faecalis]